MPDEAILYQGDSNHEIRALLASWRPNSGSHRSIPGLSLSRTERARLWGSREGRDGFAYQVARLLERNRLTVELQTEVRVLRGK
jgi:hypothetical protein